MNTQLMRLYLYGDHPPTYAHQIRYHRGAHSCALRGGRVLAHGCLPAAL